MFGIDDAAVATILAGLVSTAGALYTNKKNRDAQADANAINWEIARQNNATQIEMANTAHQREVRDLRAAGLNPILSAGGNGSSTPTLTSASMSPVHQDNAFEGLANSAKGLGRYFGQQYKADLDLSRAESKAAEIEANRLEQQYGADVSNAQNDFIMAEMRNAALRREFGVESIGRDPDDGSLVTLYSDVDAYDKAVNKIREGIRSDMKNNASSWWRNDIQAIGSGINSAAGAVRAFRVPVYRSRVNR